MFDTRFARRRANRYRRRGLDKTSRRMVDLLAQRGVQDATVLEIGGGVGEIQIELLKRGAASATNLELSSAYDAEARRLIVETGLTGRVERRLVDIAADPTAVGSADIVVLNRVVCCYPDYSTLLATAADHALQQVVFSYPPRNLMSRAAVGAQNLLFRLLRRGFRAFAHPPTAMLAVLVEHGLSSVAAHGGAVWQIGAGSR